MTHDPTRSPNPSPCLIRPAQVSDRKAIERLVRQFHQSLQLGKPKPSVAIALLGGFVVVLVLCGFYIQVIALTVMVILILQAHQWTESTLSNFWVAECEGRVIGCAKLFCYNTHSEAYLVYIDPTWRGQGYGSHLVDHLTKEATLPLYLASQPHRMPFYMRLGFLPLPPDALPMIVRHRLGIDRYQQYGVMGMVFGQR